MKSLFIPSTLVAALLLASPLAHAQTTANPNTTRPAPLTPANIPPRLQAAEQAKDADTLLMTYGQAVTDPTLARVAIGSLLQNYYSLRNLATTSDQATQAVAEATLRFLVLQSAQNQVIIQQNQQLLQQNARLIEIMERQQGIRPATPTPPR